MVINTKSVVYVNGRPARVLSNRFNHAVKAGTPITDGQGFHIVPSKGLPWVFVSDLMRQRKAVQARVDRPSGQGRSRS